jgi:hypothetical protein
VAKAIGKVVVAAFAATAASLPLATITATRRRTKSAASAGSQSNWLSAYRYSIAWLGLEPNNVSLMKSII